MDIESAYTCVTGLSLHTLKITPKSSHHLNKQFTLLCTNDVHSHFEPTTRAPSKTALGGIRRIAHYFEKCQRSSCIPLLRLEAGDYLQGTLVYERGQGKSEIEFMNIAGYDIATVGNHDLDNGLEHLLQLLQESKFQTVCANIFRDGENEPCFTPYSLMVLDGVRVAVVGIMGDDAWKSIRPKRREGLTLEEPTTCLDRLLPNLRPHVNVIVLLSHSGVKQDRIFAEKHPLIDVIIGGHSHTHMERHEQIGNVAILHAGSHGRYVGKLDVRVEGDKTTFESCVEPMDERFEFIEGHVECAEIIDLLARTTLGIDGYYNEELGICPVAIPKSTEQQGPTKLGTMICEVLLTVADADIAVMPSGSIKKGLDEGIYTVKSIHEILAHKEPLWMVKVSGKILLDLFCEGQKRWGQAQMFQYAGITLEIENARIKRAYVGGKEVDIDATYKVAGPSFFFEREMQDEKLLASLKGQEEIVAEDLRVAFARVVRQKGLII